MAKKEVKEKVNKKVNKEKKIKEKKVKKTKTPKENYFVGVRNELSKVKWPSKKEVFKYTIATIIFIVVLVVFFILLSMAMSAIKGAFN